jgi:surfeit locus 1 family protein
MPRLPILPTLVVGIAVAIMIALGVWQLDRRGEKEALIARFAANQSVQAPMAFPRFPVGEELLFRRASAFCLRVTGWEVQAGRTAAGQSGWRQIADCRTAVEGPGLKIDMGVSTDPTFKPAWTGGDVTGTITQAPSHSPMLAGVFGRRAPPGLMLVAERAAPGLQPSLRPSPANVPNNHLAYAVQWFLFAGIAVIIYLLALNRRAKRGSAAPKQG